MNKKLMVKKIVSRDLVEKCQKWREFFASIFTGPGELLGKTTQVKSKAPPGIYKDCSILCKNFKTLALIVTEEVRGQERPLQSD